MKTKDRRPVRVGWLALVLGRMRSTHVAWLALGLASTAAASPEGPVPRRVIRLDGTWQVEQGAMDSMPGEFTHIVPVPGLLDMAEPPFEEVGRKSELRRAFWYRRTFRIDGAVPEFAILKIHKAKYGTKVFLNGEVAGEHLPCFTPGLLNVKEHLNGGGEENELVVRLGADREALPEGMPTGWDFEKYLYLPGIYDTVELILTGAPFITNVQTVPDISGGAVRVVAEVKAGDNPSRVVLKGEVTEVSTGKAVGSGTSPAISLEANREGKVDLTVSIGDCRLWSPEDPFLYRLDLGTGGDAVKVRFGMRSFRFDREARRAVLNGKPYILRGSNVCIYRFFEDAHRRDLPWRADWVRRLHRRFKSMHWNSLRYCIGFPPELWYDIADEEGLLIQDEFPIWLLGRAPEKPVAEQIIPEYTEWMRERWNHPCVVMWDAQNESVTPETGKAIRAVRHLDLSGRPWENGWAEPQSPTDCVEAHPYLFIKGWQDRETFRLRDMAKVSGVPHLREPQKKLGVPVIINEYAWLWLNRDGTVTCLTDKVYESLLGPHSTVAERRLLYARYLAALTEFWRCHRECAGVLHFCGLGYSRPGDKPRPEGGATSDHFVDLENLTFEPLFAEYVREAFHPVGLMLDFWADELPGGTEREFKVYIINDLHEDWRGPVRLRVLRDGKEVSSRSREVTVAALGREVMSFTRKIPGEPGRYTIVAELGTEEGRPIRSLRDFEVKGKSSE